MEFKEQSQPDNRRDMTVPNRVPARIKTPNVVLSEFGSHLDIIELAEGNVTPYIFEEMLVKYIIIL